MNSGTPGMKRLSALSQHVTQKRLVSEWDIVVVGGRDAAAGLVYGELTKRSELLGKRILLIDETDGGVAADDGTPQDHQSLHQHCHRERKHRRYIISRLSNIADKHRS